MGEVLLNCSGICKNFGATRALVSVDFELGRGQICGLIGENGSGKSTLTSIIAGAQKQDSGEMLMQGEPYRPQSMLDGQKRKIGMIVQEMGVLHMVDVASNIFAGNMKPFLRHGLLDIKAMHREAGEILERIGAGDIHPDASIETLNFEDRKIVEIARAMYLEPEILVVDESTTALAQKGRKIIYNIMRKMQRENKAVIFISHDLDELMDLCNTITVLRDGHRIGTLNKDEMTIPVMRKMMVGRELSEHYFRTDQDGSCGEKIILRADRISSDDGVVMNLDLQMHEGEILGIGGLADSGMHIVGKMLCGLSHPITGKTVHVPSGEEISRYSTAVARKIGYISKDRDLESLILMASIRENIALPSLKNFSSGMLISGKREKEAVEEQIRALKIKCVNAGQLCTELSGGNKQKVALGKWLAYQCDIFIMDCPTRGIDIGVKAAMYDIMYQLKKAGKSILMISEELMELIGMSDRILIMKDGKISREFRREENPTESQMIEYMI